MFIFNRMSVASQENKQMLLDLMSNIINDNNLSTKNSNLINFINSKCNYFHTKRFEFGNINEINKKIIELSYNYVMASQPRQGIVANPSTDLQMSKKEIFDKNLVVQQKNFNTMIQPKKPKEIDFTDKKKDLPIGNLGVIMNQTLADRQKELETITQHYSNEDKEAAKAWLNTTSNNTENAKKIKIDQQSSVRLNNTISVLQPKKRVHFEIKEQKDGLENFLSKLKTKKTITPETSLKTSDINTKLDIIISNQEKILKLLNKKDGEEIELTPI